MIKTQISKFSPVQEIEQAGVPEVWLNELQETLQSLFSTTVEELQRYHESDADTTASDELAREIVTNKVIDYLNSFSSAE
jgi:hypothetical protein